MGTRDDGVIALPQCPTVGVNVGVVAVCVGTEVTVGLSVGVGAGVLFGHMAGGRAASFNTL